MIDIETYRARIGGFTTKQRNPTFKNIPEYYRDTINYNSGQIAFNVTKNIIKLLFILILVYPTCPGTPPYRTCISTATTSTRLPAQCSTSIVVPVCPV